MQWTKDTLKEVRTTAQLSQPALIESLGIHFRTVQNREKGTTPIPASVIPALDNLLGETQDVITPKYNADELVSFLPTSKIDGSTIFLDIANRR